MIRSFRYPLHPTQAQAATLTLWLGSCCDLYNAALQERRDAWRKLGVSVSMYDQQKSLTEIRATVDGWCDVPSHVARSALRRLDKAYGAFFRRCKASAKRPGFPRFKPKRRYDSFDIGSTAVRGKYLIRDNRVQLPSIGYVKFNQYRPLLGKVLDVVVRREADKWYVVFQCDLGEAPVRVDLDTVEPARIIGIDVGLTTLATMSDGSTVDNPRHGKAAAKRVAAAQRCLARKQRGSRSRRRAIVRVQRAYAHVANQRLDTARKVAADLTRRFDVICFEDLNIKGLASGMLGKSVNDAAWGMLLTAIEHKAESAGKYVVATDPRGTTIECSQCGHAVPKRLDERTHRCGSCGLVMGRDHNAAINIQGRGMRLLGLSVLPPITGEGLNASA